MAFLSPKTAPGRYDLILELIFDMMDAELHHPSTS
jgi:hypothetical protein